MNNLRVKAIKVIDSSTIKIKFTEYLDSLINLSNIEITSNNTNVEDPKILKVNVNKDILVVKTKPLTAYSSYYVKLKSSDLFKFKSVNGSILLEDGNTNVFLILGVEDSNNIIRNNLLTSLKDNIYDLSNQTLVKDIINSQTINISQALYDIGRLKNDNYLTIDITDELKTRGEGPSDRLLEEGAYEIIRVSKNINDNIFSTFFNFDFFPSIPITLQTIKVFNEKLQAGIGDGTFENLILNTNKNFVTKLSKVIIKYQNGTSYNYDLKSLGYQIKDSRYDIFGSSFVTLLDNQFQLNSDSFILPKAGDFIYLDYEYKDLGRNVEEDTIVVSEIIYVSREVLPPLQNIISLNKFPIINSNNIIPSSQGIIFLDPNSDPPFSTVHPAFIREIVFKLDSLPSKPGDYSIDYQSGIIYSYGAEINDGTGYYPPVISYYYRNIYKSRLDYTYNSSLQELVANPSRDLINKKIKIDFNYKNSLVPGVDFNSQIHQEVLNERIDNRLLSSNILETVNNNITNVFRILNETTGELYKITRWNGNKVYFSFSSPPRIFSQIREKVSFLDIFNETLIVNKEYINSSNIRIFEINLINNKIMSASEDALGCSFNSSVTFSKTDIFDKELYFDAQTSTKLDNVNRLKENQYVIDYENGIVLLGVSSIQEYDIGTINYKKFNIVSQYKHIISISEIYQSIDLIKGISKRISYLFFEDNIVQPSTFDLADERFLNKDITLPYLVDDQKILVTDDIKNVRGIYDHYDLMNNVSPINFYEDVKITGNIISLSSKGILQTKTYTILSGNIINLDFISNGIEIFEIVSVVRVIDNVDLWLSSGTLNNYQIIINAGNVNDVVLVTYRLKLNSSATPIVDYNRGDYFIDYTFLADEILISYEYGDNSIDFSESSALDVGEKYYVSYKAGALRDSLLKNFGSLLNISILNTFDTSLPRENYRDALKAALQSFTKGPTIPAIKSIVSNITHIDPDLQESAFQNWSLGLSNLYENKIKVTGDIKLLSGKFDYGVLVEKDQTISFPISSNLRLEEGTLEMWVIPEWNGLDNDAYLTFELEKDGYLLDVNDIYIGSDSHHPQYINNQFIIDRFDESNVGLPSSIYTKTGIFIFYDDVNKQWKVYAKDNTSLNSFYHGKIFSSGEVYNVKFIPGLGEINDVLRSGVSKIEFEFHIDNNDSLYPDGYVDGYADGYADGYYPQDGYLSGYSYDGITFMADHKHYLFDFGKENKNRFSIFKDGAGYINFNIIDKTSSHIYGISSDISSWKAGENHHIAVSWKINSSNRRDEMHLFLDGKEVFNIMKYGGRPVGENSDRFRTVKPEYIIGNITKNIIVGNDLSTTYNSNVVVSNVYNFQDLGIISGDTFDIDELNFSSYIITQVIGNTLVLNENMPASLINVKYSVNKYSTIVSSEIDIYSNIAVSILSNEVERELPGLRAEIPSYSISKNTLNQNILTILGNVSAGDQVLIRTMGLNHRRCRTTQYIWGNQTSNILKSQLPPPVFIDEVKIISILLPLTTIGTSNSTTVSNEYHATFNEITQPSNSVEGRNLAIRITSGNCDLTSYPATITINGSSMTGSISEVIIFNSAQIKNSINKFISITSVDVIVTPLILNKDCISLEIKELYSITSSNGNNSYPVIRYSYKLQTGTNLYSIGNDLIIDNNSIFSESLIGKNIIITSPALGSFTITDIIDEHTLKLSSVVAAFTDGIYQIFNVTNARGGFQNGFFTFEDAETSEPFYLNSGFYEIDYSAYLEVPFDPLNDSYGYIGSDINGSNHAKAIIDEFRILNKQLTDVRVGETIHNNEETITTDFTSLKSFEPNYNTLMLLHFDSLPIINSSNYWINATKEYLQSSNSVNENFGQSLVLNKPFVVDNKGLLSTNSEGTIEFWISPKFDTYNDPEFRFYFDATGSIVEEILSVSNGIIKVSGKISKILSVRLKNDIDNTGKDYFKGGEVLSDFQTIKLQQALPFQKTYVKVNYIPSGLSGDRISIFKDKEGYLVFNVRISEIDYQIRQSIFWSRDSWHRIQASYKFNRSDNQDEIRLFVDGEENRTVLFGSELLFNDDVVFGQSFFGDQQGSLIADLNFTDPINEFFIGSDYFGINNANARIDNLRLSNIARKSTNIFNQPKDINFNTNINLVYPVVSDVFTTYLFNFDSLTKKADDFTILRDEKYGIFDFTLDVIDSFGIVSSNIKIKQILETLISILKPAQSRAHIKYLR